LRRGAGFLTSGATASWRPLGLAVAPGGLVALARLAGLCRGLPAAPALSIGGDESGLLASFPVGGLLAEPFFPQTVPLAVVDGLRLDGEGPAVALAQRPPPSPSAWPLPAFAETRFIPVTSPA